MKTFFYLWPWVLWHHCHPPGHAAPRNDSDPSRWSVDLRATVPHREGRKCNWARRRGRCTPHLPLFFDLVPPRSASRFRRTPRTIWPVVRREKRRKEQVRRTELPSRGWRWSCPVRRKRDLSVGCSPGAAGNHLFGVKMRIFSYFPLNLCFYFTPLDPID